MIKKLISSEASVIKNCSTDCIALNKTMIKIIHKKHDM